MLATGVSSELAGGSSLETGGCSVVTLVTGGCSELTGFSSLDVVLHPVSRSAKPISGISSLLFSYYSPFLLAFFGFIII